MTTRRLRLRGGRGRGDREAEPEVPPLELEAGELVTMFASPRWLRDLGRQAWYLVGLGLVLVGMVWLLGATATIVEPVMVAGVLAAVASPAVAWLGRRYHVPRAAGAGLVLLGLLVLGVLLALLVIGGIVAQGDQISETLTRAADKIQGWAQDAGVGASGAESATEDVKSTVPDIGSTLLKGLADGISGLTSLAFFLSFLIFSTFFLLKDGPVFRRFFDRHLGIPRPVATIVTGRVMHVAAAVLPRRHDRRGVQRRGGGHGRVDPGRPAGRDDRGRGVRDRLRPVHRGVRLRILSPCCWPWPTRGRRPR